VAALRICVVVRFINSLTRQALDFDLIEDLIEELGDYRGLCIFMA
jgi:hypothetical protein